MSTRATYQIDGHCFYVHHDGYPRGAAYKIAEAVKWLNQRDGLAGAFYRANENAEFCDSHDDQSDCEYQYTITGTNITVRAREYGHEWNTTYTGPLARWLNVTTDGDDEFTMSCGRVVTIEQAVTTAKHHLECARSALEKGWTGNASGSIIDAWRAVKCAPHQNAIRLEIAALAASIMHYFWGDHGDMARWLDLHCPHMTDAEKSAI